MVQYLSGPDLFAFLQCGKACREAATKEPSAIDRLKEQQEEQLLIFPKNAPRTQANWEFFEKHAAAAAKQHGANCSNGGQPKVGWRARGLLIIDMTFHNCKLNSTTPQNTRPFASDWQRRRWHFADEYKTFRNGYAPELRVIAGRNYMLTKNITLSKGVATGMSVTIEDVVLQPNARVAWDANALAHRVYAHEVRHLTFRHKNKDWGARRLTNKLPKGHFYLTPCTPQKSADYVKKYDIRMGTAHCENGPHQPVRHHPVTRVVR